MIRKAFWYGALILLAADALMQVLAGWQGDKEWLLLASRMMLGGKTLYVDIFEVDPPLIVWLYTVPVWLSLHVTFLQDYQILVLIGLATAALAVWLGVCLIRLHPAFVDDAQQRKAFALLLAYTLVFFSTQIYFFDRDHVFFVLVFPYLLRFMPSLAGQTIPLRLRITIGVLAGIGFCIKPHTAVVFAIVQLWGLFGQRSRTMLWSMENYIIAAIAAIYLFCVWRFAPDYLTTVLPMAMATYSGFNRKINAYLFIALALVSAGLTFADFRPRHTTPYRRDVYYFIVVCLAFLAYALVGNGWGYTYNPLLCTLLFVSGWVLWEYCWLKRDAQAQGLSARPFVFGVRATAANILLNTIYIILCIGMFFLGNPCGDKECKPDPYLQYMKEHHDRSFGTMALNLRRFTSLARQVPAQWNTRFNHLWMLPQLMLDDPESARKHLWVLEYVALAYAKDLQRRKPDILFVDRSDGIFGYPHFVDIPAFFSRVPEFKEAWSHYRYVSTIDQCDSAEAESKPQKQQPSTRNKPIHIECRYDIYRFIAP